MDFEHSAKTREWMARLQTFMDQEIWPAVPVREAQLAAFGANRWQVIPIVEELKQKAKAAGLWNLFLPHSDRGPGLSNVEYGALCEIMGPAQWSYEVFNCEAPNSGNMELLDRYGNEEQKARWLQPLLNGDIRSCFVMTEPDEACSDATNISFDIRRDGDEYVLNGRKWWITGALDPRTRIWLLFGRSSEEGPKHQRHSIILVEPDTPGITIGRPMTVFGYDDAPSGHAEITFQDVRVPAGNLILGEGRGFEIMQGRMGPGRIHHCMRLIGIAEWALTTMCKRLSSRTTFGKILAERSLWQERIADARIAIEMNRLLVLKAADKMDRLGSKAAKAEIGMIKVSGPRMALQVLDDAIQAHGGVGVDHSVGLAELWAFQRALRIGDGPDEVHQRAIAQLELRRQVGIDSHQS